MHFGRNKIKQYGSFMQYIRLIGDERFKSRNRNTVDEET